MAFTIFSMDGVITPISDARVSLSSIEYTYGYGVYETIRVRRREPLFLADHLLRLRISCNTLKLEHTFSDTLFAESIRKLIAAIDQETYNIKLLLIGGETKEKAHIYMLASNPHYPDKKMYRDGVPVITRHFERAFPQAKSLNMLQSYLAYRDAKGAGAYDAVLINRNGAITEGTRTNFFAMKGLTLFSPPASEILHGVTRKHVLAVAKQLGYFCEEVAIPLDSITTYDGAFLTSTSTKIMPISSIDDTALPAIPKALRKLMDAYDIFHDTQ
jgi:branched-chain amino acid aminotransferase